MSGCTAVCSASCVLTAYSASNVFVLLGFNRKLAFRWWIALSHCLLVLGHNQYKSRTQERGDGVLRGRVGHGRFWTEESPPQSLWQCSTSAVSAPTLRKLWWKWNCVDTTWQSGKRLLYAVLYCKMAQLCVCFTGVTVWMWWSFVSVRDAGWMCVDIQT